MLLPTTHAFPPIVVEHLDPDLFPQLSKAQVVLFPAAIDADCPTLKCTTRDRTSVAAPTHTPLVPTAYDYTFQHYPYYTIRRS